MDLGDLIDLNRVVIERETKSSIHVTYGNEKYTIEKNDETCFASSSSPDRAPSISLKPRLEQLLQPECGTFQDENAPREFWEVMIFHELMEQKYENLGSMNPHQEAVHAEILYVLKHFPTEAQERYFAFAKEYRAKNKKTTLAEELPAIDICTEYLKWIRTTKRIGDAASYERAEQAIGERSITKKEFERLMQLHQYQRDLEDHCNNYVYASETQRATMKEPECPESIIALQQQTYTYGQDVNRCSIPFLAATINKITTTEGNIDVTISQQYIWDEQLKPSNCNASWKPYLKRKNVEIKIKSAGEQWSHSY